jgi:molecular chaperone HtpG
MESETFAFSADINQLLSLIINTIYSNKEVFLRELISNASDALQKIRYESLTDTECLTNEPDLKIEVSFDRNAKILKIFDTGVGMTKEELINNLGTIASSGTKKFLESLSATRDISLIGQFGVGFYSAFLIASKVSVVSKNNNDEQYEWISDGSGSFTILQDSNDYGFKRGTLMQLFLKDDAVEYMDQNRIVELIKKHNQFIDFPIYVQMEKTRTFEVEVEPEEKPETNEEKPETNEENPETNEEKPETTEPVKTMKTETETYNELEQINKNKPIWTRNSKDVEEEEYVNFYKSFTGETDDYLDHIHFSVEGQVEFKGILFIPKKSPHEITDNQTNKKGHIKLYVQKVLITDDCSEMLPDYLKFAKGVIETENLPLNISRESLQENKIIKIIGKNVTKKVFDMFNNISNDSDKFRIFYEQYSKFIKLGIHEDSTYRTKLAALLRFETTKSDGDLISFDDYIENMQEGHNDIYFISGESIKSINNSLFLERFKKKDMEVIFMADPLDEYLTQQLKDYKEKKLVCVTKENINLNESDQEKADFEKSKEDFKIVCDFFKTTLNDEVEKVIISNKLSDSPCVLSTSEFGWTANMQRILKAQTFGRPEMNFMMGRKILEINPNNEIIQKIKAKLDSKEEDLKLSETVNILYEITLQSSGFTLEDPSIFNSRILKLVNSDLES